LEDAQKLDLAFQHQEVDSFQADREEAFQVYLMDLVDQNHLEDPLVDLLVVQPFREAGNP
jgi:hypothetical protein